MNMKTCRILITVISICAIVVLGLCGAISATADDFSAYDTVCGAGVGTCAGDISTDDTSDETVDYSDIESGQKFYYLDGKRCFALESKSGVIVTCE